MGTITTRYSSSDSGSALFSALRAYETGSAAGNTGEEAGGAYGAYQMRAAALQDAGAIVSDKTSLSDSSNWTGQYGTSLSDFLRGLLEIRR